jgi:hypothetical protein
MQANLVEIETDYVVLMLVVPTGGSAPTSDIPSACQSSSGQGRWTKLN